MTESTKQLIRNIPGTISLYMFCRRLLALPWFIKDLITFKTASRRDGRFTTPLFSLHPILIDKTSTTHFEPHYTYHPAWAARIVANSGPKKHVDISSTLAFSTIVSAFMPVEFYDYRPATLNLDGLVSEHADLTKLQFASDSIASLSCMHTVEHVGLGRYGDPVDPQGDIKAAAELARVLQPGGQLIFVVPVGRSRIEFNAHRVYAYDQVLALFPTLILKEFSMVPDDHRQHGLVRDANPSDVKNQYYACGCFVFTK